MSEDHRVTLADIARQAGVHVSTVSLALRDHPRIPEPTKKRIREVAGRLGYTPDPLLSALSTYRTKGKGKPFQATLAYLTNWSTEWGWRQATGHTEFFAGAQEMARQLGFKLDHFWLNAPNLTRNRLAEILRVRGITGLIIASHAREMGDELNLDLSNFSCVKIDYFPHQPLMHNVTNNQCSIVRLAMQRAMAAGYKRIGMIMHRGWDHAVDLNWTAGYLCEQQQIAEADRVPPFLFPSLHPIESWFSQNNAIIIPDRKDLQAWLRQYKPEVVLSNWAFVEPAFKALGLQVPRDIAFIDLFLTDYTGRTAGVRQNHEMVGALAVELVSGKLKNNQRGIPSIPLTTFVDGTWFDGASCPAIRSRTGIHHEGHEEQEGTPGEKGGRRRFGTPAR